MNLTKLMYKNEPNLRNILDLLIELMLIIKLWFPNELPGAYQHYSPQMSHLIKNTLWADNELE